jgi:uncharacterized secreted protein with C-terminal beta-propeller domain
MSKKIFKLSLTLAIFVFALSACTLPWQKKAAVVTPGVVNNGTVVDNSATSTNQIKKFDNYDDLKIFLEENNSNVSISSPAGTTATGVSFDNSAANSQTIAGEADIVKSDGNYVYTLVRNDLKITKINPAADSAVVSTITFKSRPQGILINGANVAVFGIDQQFSNSDLYKSFRRQNPYTFFKVYDLSDPSNPKIIRDLNFEGSYTDARLNGDYVYLFTKSQGNYIDSEPLVPRVIDGGAVLPSSCDSSTKCFTPDVYYFDIPYGTYSFANVTAININDNSEALAGESFLLNDGQNMYVSPNNIYISYTQTVNQSDLEQGIKKDLLFSKLSADDQDKITKIEAVASYILSPESKQIKVAAIIDSYINSLTADEQTAIQTSVSDALKQKISGLARTTEKTIIYKLSINNNKVESSGMGEVSGQVLNQSAMDENGDYFRIVTTFSPIWSMFSDKPNEASSNVYVLDSNLQVVGSLENLATNEKIISASFVGNRVYFLTPLSTDPLYVIGLDDPTKPAALGAIKVPEYSSYLQTVDANGNKLIGFGRDTGGLKLTLFDFTDLSKPKELDSYLISDQTSDSIALTDHQAFFYSDAKKLLSLPTVLKDNGTISFAGSLIFSTINDKFVLQGKINHLGDIVSADDYWNGYDYYDNTVKRSFYINDNLYTFSNNFLKINALSDLKTIKNVTLTSGVNDYTITPTTPPAQSPVSETPATTSPDTSSTPEIPSPDTSSTSETPLLTGSTSPEIVPPLNTSTPSVIN